MRLPTILRLTGPVVIGLVLLLGFTPGEDLDRTTQAPELVTVAAEDPPNECLDENGAPTGCQFDVAPIPLPAGLTLGEYETAFLTRPFYNQVNLGPEEFRTGSEVGACRPENGACQSTASFPLGSDPGGNVTVPPASKDVFASSFAVDTAMASEDFNGDGLSEIVAAGPCRVSNTEICINVFDPQAAADVPGSGWSGWQPTGLDAETLSFGRIRLATGLINERAARIVDAHYEVSDDSSGMLATFTTQSPTEYRPGQLVRFKSGSDLEGHLCVASSDGDEQCITDLGDHYLPIESVDPGASSFSVRLGRLVDAEPGGDGAVVPDDWSADDCGGPSACGADSIAVSPGLGMAYASPGGEVSLAAFSVSTERAVPARLLDSVNVGALQDDSGRSPFDLVAADFDGGGTAELVVVYDATAAARPCVGTGGGPCVAAAFVSTNNGRQVYVRTRQRLFAGAPANLDAAGGAFINDAASRQEGADLVVATALGTAHQFRTFDVSTGLVTTAYDTVDVSTGLNAGAVARSFVKVVAADLDLDGTDEIAVAETKLNVSPTADTTSAPIDLAVYQDSDAGWVQRARSSSLGQAAGGFGSGQVDLAVGGLGRNPPSVPITYPNDINPDLLVSWTCATCASGDSGVSYRPFNVAISDVGNITLNGSGTFAKPGIALTGALPVSEASAASMQLGDFNADSQTLGFPVTYVKVGQVRPILILRAPPVHIDAFDENGDPGINYFEVQDINGCFAREDCSGDSHISYEASSTVESNVSGTVTNDWGVSASLKIGIGNEDVPAEAYVKGTIDYAGKNEESGARGKSFAASTAHTVSAGEGDQAYAATQSIRVTEYPIYAGVSPFAENADPLQHSVSINPAHTELGWIDLNNPDYGFDATAAVPGNLLSYADGKAELPVAIARLDKVSFVNAQQIRVEAKQGLGLSCNVAQWQNLSTQYLAKFPCGGGGVALTLKGTKSFDGSYTVTTVESADKAVLTRAAGANSATGNETCNTSCYLVRDAGEIATGFETVSKGTTASGTVTMASQTSFSGSASWNLGGSLEVYGRLGGSVSMFGTDIPAPLYEMKVSGRYARTEASTLSVAATEGTTWKWSIGSLPTRGVSYRVRPWLVEDPLTHAMSFEWTATCGTCSQAYWDYYEKKPDPAFALPHLMDPFKSPNGIPNIQGVDLLQSPSFFTWQCDSEGVCRRLAAAPAGERLTLGVNVHNYSLKAFQSKVPLKVRFFAGDPGRGGYQIAETSVPNADRTSPDAKAECGAARFCMPSKSSAVARASWTPPAALGGVGTRTTPFPIYAVIDPTNAIREVHDWTKPVNLKSCYQTYPYLPPAPKDQYDVPEAECPTINNQGYFLQEFAGPSAPRTDLFVATKDITVADNGRSVSVKVHSSKKSNRALLRLWVCRPSAGCSPATSAKWSAQAQVVGIPAGGIRKVTVPVKVGTGKWRIVAQVVPVTEFEPLGEAGFSPSMDRGKLENNVAVRVVER